MGQIDAAARAEAGQRPVRGSAAPVNGRKPREPGCAGAGDGPGSGAIPRTAAASAECTPIAPFTAAGSTMFGAILLSTGAVDTMRDPFVRFAGAVFVVFRLTGAIAAPAQGTEFRTAPLAGAVNAMVRRHRAIAAPAKSCFGWKAPFTGAVRTLKIVHMPWTAHAAEVDESPRRAPPGDESPG